MLDRDYTNGTISFVTGKELRENRIKLGLTQGELGRRLGVTLTSIWRWEHGQRRVPELAARLMSYLEKEVKAEQRPKQSRPKRRGAKAR